MIDYDVPDEDPVIADVRRAREQLAAEHGFDLAKLFAEMEKRQATSQRAYSTPARRAENSLPSSPTTTAR
jgi:hypothetical protein